MRKIALRPKEKQNLEIQPARNGRGIFAKRDFLPEEIIFEVRGIVRSGNEDESMDEQTRDNMYRYDADSYISPEGTLGDLLNHSCNPNARIIKKDGALYIEAIRRIQKDREICMDYSTIIARDDCWRMRCNCGSKKCRGVVGAFRKLPEAIRQNYIKRQIVPEYILEI
jgi:SET domain-containing protein